MSNCPLNTSKSLHRYRQDSSSRRPDSRSRIQGFFLKHQGALTGIGCGCLCFLFCVSCGFLSNLSGFHAHLSKQEDAVTLLTYVFLSVPDFMVFMLPPYCYFLFKTLAPIKKNEVIWVVYCAIISMAIVLSCALGQTESLQILVSSKLASLLSFCSFFATACVLSTMALPLARKLSSALNAPPLHRTSLRLPYAFALLPFWLPYILAFAPGTTCYDFSAQLAMVVGAKPLTTHFPLISTLICGLLFYLPFSLFGNPNLALFAIVTLQSISLILAVGYVLKELGELGASRRTLICAFGFYAFVPIFGLFCQWAVKDCLFAVAFTVYATSFVSFARKPRCFLKSHKMAVFVISSIFTGLLRNNGFYVVLLSLPAAIALIDNWHAYRRSVVLLCSVILIIPAINLTAVLATSSELGSIREMLSIPFQQTARYASEHPDDMEEWEKSAIDSVLDLDSLSELYNPSVSDPVKSTFDANGSLINYFAAWIAQGMRHPLTYFEATAMQTYGYWSVQEHITYPQELPGRNCYDTIIDLGWGPWLPDEVRSFNYSLTTALINAPILSLFTQIGFYTWVLLFGVSYLIYRRQYKYLVVFLPCLVLLLTNIAGPLNGSVRYGFGLMVVAPLMTYAAVSFGRRAGDPTVRKSEQ